tara:strand:- start:576 stop:803 length:228 start_codon:yes stop_codon:yes gene_type:complete
MSEKKIDFEQTLTQLQSTVQALEKGQLPLEQALEKFQEAMRLSKQCQEALKNAELKITQLTEDGKLVDGLDGEKA